VREFYRSHFAWSFDSPASSSNAKGGEVPLRPRFLGTAPCAWLKITARFDLQLLRTAIPGESGRSEAEGNDSLIKINHNLGDAQSCRTH
jgi:hypothetical protein